MSRALLFRLFILLSLLVAGAFGGLYFLRPEVVVAPVRRGTAVAAVPGTVTVRAERVYPVVSEAAGRIIEHNLKVGQMVAAREVLVQIDRKAVEIELAELAGRLAAVRKRVELGSTRQFDLENARDRLVFSEALLQKNAIPISEVETQRRAVLALEQGIALESVDLDLQQATLRATIEARESLLNKMTLSSPIDGVVSRIEAFAGDLIGSGTVIAEIISLTRIVDARISEENFENVKLGQSATVRLAGYGGGKFTGTVSKLPTTADPETQRYIVELTVTAEPALLVPGMTGEAVITVSERANALLVPRPALVWDHVFVIADGRATRRDVKVGFTALNEAEIIEGVAENELVAVDGLDFLRDGTRVRVKAP
jgi:RND family efflux transporter MFP subunit